MILSNLRVILLSLVCPTFQSISPFENNESVQNISRTANGNSTSSDYGRSLFDFMPFNIPLQFEFLDNSDLDYVEYVDTPYEFYNETKEPLRDTLTSSTVNKEEGLPNYFLQSLQKFCYKIPFFNYFCPESSSHQTGKT